MIALKKIRCWRVYETRERRASIKVARVKRLRSEDFERRVIQRCLDTGVDPNCPYQRLAAAWGLAAEGWKEVADAWEKIYK